MSKVESEEERREKVYRNNYLITWGEGLFVVVIDEASIRAGFNRCCYCLCILVIFAVEKERLAFFSFGCRGIYPYAFQSN